jgi:hypothetical protein
MSQSNLEDWDQYLPNSPNGHTIPDTRHRIDEPETRSIKSDIMTKPPVKNAPQTISKPKTSIKTQRIYTFANLFKQKHNNKSKEVDIDGLSDIVIEDNTVPEPVSILPEKTNIVPNPVKPTQDNIRDYIYSYINQLIDSLYSSFSDTIYNWAKNKPEYSSTFITFRRDEILNSFKSYEELGRIQLKDLYYGNIVLEFVPNDIDKNFPVVFLKELIENIIKNIGFNISVHENIIDDKYSFVFSCNTPIENHWQPVLQPKVLTYYQPQVYYQPMVQYLPVAQTYGAIIPYQYSTVDSEECYKHSNCIIESIKTRESYLDGVGGFHSRRTVKRHHIKKHIGKKSYEEKKYKKTVIVK